MNTEVEHVLVLTTCPGTISAKKIAQTLVHEKLSACVNIVPERMEGPLGGSRKARN